MDDEFLLWPAMMNFDSLMIYLNNLHPPINYTYVKANVTREEIGNSVQILIFFYINVIHKSKNEISIDVL